jgi:predicted GNAT family acetyltransferase
MSNRSAVTVTEDPAAHGFVGTLDDGTTVGGAYYLQRGDVLLFNHTEVLPQFEGQGVGSQLAAEALAAVRATGRKMVPVCPFIVAYMDRHPEYDDVLARTTNLGSRIAGPVKAS